MNNINIEKLQQFFSDVQEEPAQAKKNEASHRNLGVRGRKHSVHLHC